MVKEEIRRLLDDQITPWLWIKIMYNYDRSIISAAIMSDLRGEILMSKKKLSASAQTTAANDFQGLYRQISLTRKSP